MKYIFWLVFLYIQIATAQTYRPDKIVLDGVQYDFRYHHMETYFKFFNDKRPVVNKDSTIVSRGYIAEYEIKDNALYFKDLKTPINDDYSNLESNTKKVFSEGEKELKMFWVTGLFDIGLGDPIFPTAKDSLRPIYDNYLVIEIEKGEVKRTNTFSYKIYKSFKDYQLSLFKSSGGYNKLYNRLLETSIAPHEIDSHITYHILYYSKRNFLKKE